MSHEVVSPELALVDPALAARARASLVQPAPPPRRSIHPVGPVPAGAEPTAEHRHYPAWARVTAALWLLVLGILVGGAAIPHAQDTPRVIPKDDDAVVTVCRPATTTTPVPRPPRGHLGGT